MSRPLQITQNGFVTVAVLAAALLLTACQAQSPSAAVPASTTVSTTAGVSMPPANTAAVAANSATSGFITTPSGLQYRDSKLGSGATAKAGMQVSVHYTGWLQNPDGSLGRKFDSSRDANQPFKFALGSGNVIRGWDEGVQGMMLGGQRRLIIPAALGYGQRGAGGGLIPPGATLIFDVELLGL